MRRPLGPILRFSPYAWAKLLAFRDYGPTEIAGFGVATGPDVLLITDFVTVPQRCTAATVAMDDEGVADYFEQQVGRGLKPQQFARLWLHTHPGHPGLSAEPSTTDEETFERVFGNCDWAVMAILARGGQTYARLRFGVGPGGQMLIPVQVDFSVPFPEADHDAWRAEYDRHVVTEARTSLRALLDQAGKPMGGRGAEVEGKIDEREGRAHGIGGKGRQWFEDFEDFGFAEYFDRRDAQALVDLEADMAAAYSNHEQQESEVPF